MKKQIQLNDYLRRTNVFMKVLPNDLNSIQLSKLIISHKDKIIEVYVKWKNSLKLKSINHYSKYKLDSQLEKGTIECFYYNVPYEEDKDHQPAPQIFESSELIPTNMDSVKFNENYGDIIENKWNISKHGSDEYYDIWDAIGEYRNQGRIIIVYLNSDPDHPYVLAKGMKLTTEDVRQTYRVYVMKKGFQYDRSEEHLIRYLQNIGARVIHKEQFNKDFNVLCSYSYDSDVLPEMFNKHTSNLMEDIEVFVNLRGMSKDDFYTADLDLIKRYLLGYIESYHVVRPFTKFPDISNPTLDIQLRKCEMGSTEFIKAWSKYIKGTSYPIAGDDCSWKTVIDNLEVGDAVVMYTRDNPNVPIVYELDEFYEIGMAPNNKLDKYCMVHVMDKEFLSLRNGEEVCKEDEQQVQLQSVYDIPLHETSKVDQFTYVQRVPGGWLYHCTHLNDLSEQHIIDVTTTFVPWNNEFHQDE